MTPTAYTCALGARLLSEANDIKRTPESLASEMGLPLSNIEDAIAGRLRPTEYQALFEAVARRYPISFNRLWIEPTDTDTGVLHMKVEESKATSRVFARPDGTGQRTPYYEYRDTATSRTAPFRPEWIRQLRTVNDCNPLNPDVAYNKGHFLHQATLFVGPVNFYWEVDGKRYAAEMNTGDSNYITPFWPHSFASRDASKTAFIVAVTYGGEVARAREELSRIGESVTEIAVNLRQETAAYGGLLKRHLTHEFLPEHHFSGLCAQQGLDPNRIAAFLNGRAVPTTAEIGVIADVLCVTPRDLMPPLKSLEDEVVVLKRDQAGRYPYPDPANACYEITRLARAPQQPGLKAFLVKVLPGREGAEMRLGLHQYLYNFGEVDVHLVTRTAESERVVLLAPGDSAYIAPMTSSRFGVNGPQAGELYLVCVPGGLHTEAVLELSGMAPSGLSRAISECLSWF